jgi:hypothetical protein
MTHTNNIPKWEDIGVAWKQQPVHSRPDRNASQKIVVDPAAELMVLMDTDKFRAAYGDEPILAGCNGTSWDVTGERICRTHGKLVKAGKAAPWTVDEKRIAVLSAIIGLRTATGATRTITVTVVVMQLPNGERYEGTDPIEWAQLFIAAGTEMGLTVDVARTIAIKQWDTVHPEAPFAADAEDMEAAMELLEDDEDEEQDED